MLSKIIRNFIAKRVAGRSDDGIMITLKDPKKVDLETAKFQELLMRNGIDPMAITNENQIKNIINQINKPKVISQDDPKFKGIMSRMMGKNVIKADFGPGFKQEIEKMRGDMPPPGSRGGADDIAAPVQSAEEATTNLTDSTIQNMLKMEPIEAMKEANKVIKREGIYKALNKKQAKKILDDTEDHIFERNFKTPDDPDFDPESMADGGRIGFFKGAVASGENISPGTDTKGNVRDDNPFTGGGGDNNQPPQTKQTLTTTQTKDSTKKNILKNIGGFAFNRFLNSMGIPTKDIQKALAIKGIIEQAKQQAGGLIFPEGDLQNIIATAPSQKVYNIEATKDMVENLPGGIVKDILAPAGALVMSPVYDTFQGIQRGLEDPNKSVLQAIKDENVLSSALERFTGAAAPLAEKFEKGGRVGYKKGTVDLARRGFMKAAAGVGAGIGALKMGALKLFGKEGTRQVTKNIIKTDNVPGKPEWFDALVTKVINQGEDVTKRFATQEREIVHKLDIDKFEDVTVYRNMDTGEIRVSYESPTNVGEQSVDLVYKKPLPDEGDPRPSAEFYAVEPEPRVVNMDGDMEFDGENLVNSVDELMSDTNKLKMIAKGDAKPTLKEFVESKKKKDAAKSLNENPVEQAEYLETKYGPAADENPDFASGGIARMLGE